MSQPRGNVILYVDDSGKSRVEVTFEGETAWLSQAQIADLYQTTKQNISLHIKNIYDEEELSHEATVKDFLTVQNEGDRKVERKIEHYNLDMIISLGYRVKSSVATKFRIWATERLREYIKKGFTIDSERLKGSGGGNYWKELLDEIRDIRSSEKVLYRQVLDLYATAVDYDPKSDESVSFFKIVQNKLHYAAHGHTASEVIYMRVDSDKPFAGITNFKGAQPTQAEAMIAKNYLSVNELKVLNNLVSAYFDIAELNAIEQRPMRMADYVGELDTVLTSARRKILSDAGKISHKKAIDKAKAEHKKYHTKSLSEVERSYLETLKKAEKQLKGRKK